MKPKIDIHIHLAGRGTNGSGCYLAPFFEKSLAFRFLRFVLKISDSQMKTSIDLDWAEKISGLVKESPLDYGVVLGFDGVYNRSTGQLIKEKTQMIVPDEWVFKVCERFSNLLPGVSINPYHQDAMKRLDLCLQRGAVLLKWLPSAQGINPADHQLLDFYKSLAKAKLPLLLHIGGERTFREISSGVNDLRFLRFPLDLGVKIICAHSATKIFGSWKEKNQLPLLEKMCGEYPHLYLDNAGMCNPARFVHVQTLVKNPLFQARTIYGSDYPVPVNAIYFIRRLGWKMVRKFENDQNYFSRDFSLKLALGYDQESVVRANDVLLNAHNS